MPVAELSELRMYLFPRLSLESGALCCRDHSKLGTAYDRASRGPH